MKLSPVKSRKSRILWLLAVGGLALGSLAYKGRHSSPLQLGTVIRGELVQRVTIAGSVVPIHKSVLAAPYAGYVRKIFVHVGDHVQAGQPIISVSQTLRSDSTPLFPLRAPFDGTVVQVLKSEGEYVDPANNQNGANNLVRIDDLSHLYVSANIPEVEIEKLKDGQGAVLKASAILDRTYHGVIKSISLAATDQQ